MPSCPVSSKSTTLPLPPSLQCPPTTTQRVRPAATRSPAWPTPRPVSALSCAKHGSQTPAANPPSGNQLVAAACQLQLYTSGWPPAPQRANCTPRSPPLHSTPGRPPAQACLSHLLLPMPVHTILRIRFNPPILRLPSGAGPFDVSDARWRLSHEEGAS
jgi:hypothetical protein